MSEKTKDIYIELNDGDNVLGSYVLLESGHYDDDLELDNSALTGSVFAVAMHKVKQMIENYNRNLACMAKFVPKDIVTLRFFEALPFVVTAKVFAPVKTAATEHLLEEYNDKYVVENLSDHFAVIALDKSSIDRYRVKSSFYISININTNMIITRGFVNLLTKKELCKLRSVKDIFELPPIREEWKNPIMHFRFNEIEDITNYICNNSNGFTFKDHFVAIN